MAVCYDRHMSDDRSHPHPACLDPERLLAECQLRFTRRSGPGGQNRNKVETAVVLLHRPTGLEAEANERRSQGENRREAIHRLRVRLAVEVRTPAEQSLHVSPSPLWKSRCRGGRLQINPGHDDFPALLAEALDVIVMAGFDPKPAAERLGCSSTQLIKLLQHEPRAMAWWNNCRLERGLHRLR